MRRTRGMASCWCVLVAMVGQTKGLGLDIPAAYVGRIEASMVELASWIRTTCIAVHNGMDNIYTQLFVQFEGLLKSQADLGHELKQLNQTSHISMLMGSTTLSVCIPLWRNAGSIRTWRGTL